MYSPFQWSQVSFTYDTWSDGYATNRKGIWYYPVQYSYNPYFVNILHSGTDRMASFKIAWDNVSSTFGFQISYINSLSTPTNRDPWGFVLFSIGY